MPLNYTADGLPYWQDDGLAENRLYPSNDAATEQALAQYANSLPVDPGFTHQEYIPTKEQQVISELTGGDNKERYQLWPEKMVRSALSLPVDVMQGNVLTGPGLRREDFTDNPGQAQPLDPLMERAQDVAGLAGSGPLAIKPGTASVGSGMTRNVKLTPVEHDPFVSIEKAPMFYSAVENAVKNAKQAKATSEQWLGYIKNQPGVKQEELSWLGLDKPEGLGTNQVTKQQLEDYIAAHKVELKEVNKGNVEWHELRYKDTLARRLQGFKDLPINDETDVMAARKHNPNFNVSTQGISSSQVLKALEEAKNLPDFDNNLFQKYDTRQEALDAIKHHGAEGHIEEPLKRMKEVEIKYHSYQLPGGENYREMLLSMPEKKGQISIVGNNNEGWGVKYPNGIEFGNYTTRQQAERVAKSIDVKEGNIENPYTSSHWDEANVLGHVRMNDRVIDGKKTLHLEELQSDWHQAGRKSGYDDPKARKEVEDKLNKASYPVSAEDALLAARDGIITRDEAKLIANRKNIPDAPFKQSWPDLLLKRMIRHAAENGYDAISWTPGEAQAARYDLSKQIEKIHFIKTDKGILLAPEKKGGGEVPVNNGLPIPEDKIADYIGKEVADKIIERLNNEPKRPTELPEGYHLNKDGNEWGVIPPNQIHARSMVGLHSSKEEAVRQAINHIHSEQVQKNGTLENVDLKIGGEGMKAFYDKMLVDKANAIAKKFGSKVEQKDINDAKNKFLKLNNLSEDNLHFNVRNLMQTAIERNGQIVHFLPLTPELKNQALHKGFPLFSGGLMLSPVDSDPFSKHKLVPVQGDPFK